MVERESYVAPVLKQYSELNAKLKEKEKLFESKVEEYDELDLSMDGVKEELFLAEKKLNEKRFEMYDAKKEYISDREFKHNLKVFLIGSGFVLIVSLFPQLSALFASKIGTLLIAAGGGLFLNLFDSVLFRNVVKYSKEFSESEMFKKITSEYEILDKDFKEKLNKFNNAVMRYQECEAEIDILKKEIRDLEYSLSRLYADTFRHIYADYLEETEDKPLELKRK